MTDRQPTHVAPDRGGEQWWKSAVVYQVYPRSFADSDGDGIGDLRGITGAARPPRRRSASTCVWLSPVYPSPQDDNGYDISDYTDIDPTFGTLADLDELLAERLHAPRHEAGHGPGGQPHLRRAPVVRRVALVAPTTRARLVLVASGPRRACSPATPGAEPNNWGGFFSGSGLGVRRGDRRVLPAPVLAQAARPQLGEPRGPPGALRR